MYPSRFRKQASAVKYLKKALTPSDLTPFQKMILKHHYGLDSEANLVLRDAGRRAAGLAGGAAGGGALGAAAGMAADSPALAALLGTAGAVAGAPAALDYAKKKYSKRTADEAALKYGKSALAGAAALATAIRTASAIASLRNMNSGARIADSLETLNKSLGDENGDKQQATA